VSKRAPAFILAVLCLVIGGAAGFAWHAPGRSSTWDDIRTWVGFAVLIIGAGTALYQLKMQRDQLKEQHEVITNHDQEPEPSTGRYAPLEITTYRTR
jgi:TRAP-type C4-dicarboxylate transport system permease small subunit